MHQTSVGFCIYIDTRIEGSVPVVWSADRKPLTYPTREAAELEITEDAIERIRQFLAGERDFEDAMTVEEYVVQIDILSDGSIVDESGNHFGQKNW